MVLFFAVLTGCFMSHGCKFYSNCVVDSHGCCDPSPEGGGWHYEHLHLAPSSCSRQHLSYDDCLEIRTENNQNCSVLCCV